MPTKKKGPVKKEKKEEQKVCLSLGSNLGDRETYIRQAIYLLEKTEAVKVLKVSSIYETEPEGEDDQPLFLNAAVSLLTTLKPQELLNEISEIESTLGRERGVQWGPRTIDLDILIYGNEIVNAENLQIPHPLMHERGFVLKPLAEIEPNLVHPAFGSTIQDMAEELSRELGDEHDVELKGEFKRLTSSRDFHGLIKESTFE